jgi:ABC-type transporter Mla subunit MlaD
MARGLPTQDLTTSLSRQPASAFYSPSNGEGAKKIQILPSEVYIKFIITEKDLVLPSGVTATIEASGLGGSKALEIYPPDKDNPSNKIINVKDPTRLSKVMGIFDGLFKELDAIIVTTSNAARQFDKKIIKNNVTPVEANKQLDSLNKSLDDIQNSKNKFMKNFEKNKGE